MRNITHRPNSPWYNDDLHNLKREKRTAERKWKKSGLTVHKQVFYDKCKAYREALNASKIEYHQSKIQNCNQNQLFRVVDRLSVHKPKQVLPSHSTKKELVQPFAEYFDNKVRSLRENLNSVPANSSIEHREDQCESTLTEFSGVTEEDVLEIIKGSKIKSCPRDPLPACLLSDNLDLLLPHITAITRLSLYMGVFPDALKSALVTPILKKPNLDPEVMKNYRPISNLAFQGKVIKRCAMKQFVSYLDCNDLLASSQSAYRQYHSIETALTRVYNDILMDLDKQGGETVLVLLDLSAAFDTIDHTVFINRLRSRYCVGGAPLNWFSSYLHNRSQSVLVDNVRSQPVLVDFSMPQGSVCGPICFILYTAPLESIITRHGLSCMKYADDSQLYISLNVSTQQNAN